ncbi:MAG: hypothetical protein NT019_02650 [Candidatus Adlerbacteria bacterium]|nr:hypothetical protein [Candidatus Adlerbacteria bacterium]
MGVKFAVPTRKAVGIREAFDHFSHDAPTVGSNEGHPGLVFFDYENVGDEKALVQAAIAADVKFLTRYRVPHD